jgi:hypothetical protein
METTVTRRAAACLPFATLLLLGTAALAPARADDPTPEQRGQIEAVLRERGFTAWDEIERENGGREWEVDDARHTDGRTYDLRLAADDLRELSRRED